MKRALPPCTGSSAITQCSSHQLWLFFRKSFRYNSPERVIRTLPAISMRLHTPQTIGKIDKDNCRHHCRVPFKVFPLTQCLALNPYTYTTGRWLRNDSEERAERYIEFDFDQLRRRVVKLCPGANRIDSFEKKEGGFNRIFIFTCDNKKRIVARLPTKAAGPSRLTTHSEIATIHYRKFDQFLFQCAATNHVSPIQYYYTNT